MTNYNQIATDNLNALMKEIAEYTRMAEEIGATYTKTTVTKRFRFV